MPEPYVLRYPGDRITAEDWNSVQRSARAELSSAQAELATTRAELVAARAELVAAQKSLVDLSERLKVVENTLAIPEERPGTGIVAYMDTFAPFNSGVSSYYASPYTQELCILSSPRLEISVLRPSLLVLHAEGYGSWHSPWHFQFSIGYNSMRAPLRVNPDILSPSPRTRVIPASTA